MNQLYEAIVLAAGDGPSTVTPNYQYLPVTSVLKSIAGGAQGVGIILCIIVLVIAACTWAFGKASGSQGMQKGSAAGMIIALVAGAVIATAPAAIDWATGLQLFPAA